MSKSVMATSGAIRSGQRNHIITSGDYGDFHIENITDAETLQRKLTTHLEQHNKVRMLHRCFGCNKGKSALLMSAFLPICRDCFKEFKSKGPIAQNNFIERLKSDIGRSLRRLVRETK